tara:strand:- start:1252 stop:2337 length:1086 start_codon:yes stop_codon:yes gene_type:complete
VLITELKLENFRCYEFIELPIKSGVTLIYGENGSGKSSIIEALYFSISGKSFRATDVNAVIRKSLKQTQTFITFSNDIGIKITKNLNEKSKIIQTKDKKILSYSQLVTNYPSCLIENKEFFFTTSSPEEKRSFLNKTLFYVEQNSKKTLNELKKLLYQRSACLKNRDLAQLSYWDSKLIQLEPLITKNNLNLVQSINEMLKNSNLSDHFSKKNPWLGDLRILYSHGYDKNQSFSSILQQNMEKDMILRRTTAGPHRRTFDLLIKNKPAHEILSRGQQKIVSIILHLLQRELIKIHTKKKPIVLMDDISSELDNDNANLMLKYLLNNNIQTIMTSIENKRFLDEKDLTMFYVEQIGDKSNVK